MNNTDRHPECHMRTALGNCDPIGGFCTSVNEHICEALHKVSRPQEDSVSRQYLLAEIDDLADEFSEVDENGLHSERWCGIMDSKGIIVNAPSESSRPQGEWIMDEHPYYETRFKCSNCGESVPWDYEYGIDLVDKYRTCPFCDARMKG